MKKIYLFFCMLGIAVPYYHLFNYLTENNWYWSTSEFFELTYANSAVSMILGDLTVSVFAFFAFIVLNLNVMVDVMFSAMIDIMINGTFSGISGKYAQIILQYY